MRTRMTENRFNLFALCFSFAIVLTIAVQDKEELVIRKAAERNGCRGDNYLILLAIRKAENGKLGCEFGVKGKAWNTTLDRQAGWAAATIMAQRKRTPGLSDRDFINVLADCYCPPSCDPIGHRNWKKNVWYWFARYKNLQK